MSNIYLLEHINLSIQKSCNENTSIARFYLEGLGFARDPRFNMFLHVNIGLSQFHFLPNQSTTQCLRGHIGLFFPDLNILLQNLDPFIQDIHMNPPITIQNYPEMKNMENISLFDDSTWKERILLKSDNNYIQIKDCNGNIIRCFETPNGYNEISKSLGTQPGKKSMGDGLFYICFDSPKNTSKIILDFYSHFLYAKAFIKIINGTSHCFIECGELQYIIFKETDSFLHVNNNNEDYHICIYIKKFKESYKRCEISNLLWNNPIFDDRCDTWNETEKEQQFRILNIICPISGKFIMQLEHEIRSFDHKRNPLRLSISSSYNRIIS